MAQENISVQLNDLLASRDFQAELLDREGRPTDAENADIFTFDYVSSSGKDYGTMVIILDAENEMQVFYGDNLGRSMEGNDKNEFFDFVQHLHKFANMRRWTYSPKNINQVKYTMQGLAAIKEGLFEGYYGTRKVSYSGEPTQARLVIQHNRPLGETDARYRYVESLFIETADSQRFKLQFKNLTGARAMLEHVRQGGFPYDVRGSHITETVNEIATLSRFNRASAGRVLEGITAELVTEAQTYYKRLRENMKRMASPRGYSAYFETWHPATIDEQQDLVEDIKTLFIEQTLDTRIEAALPLLARIQQQGNAMKEAQIFENWINNLAEGTWSLPETPEQLNRLKELMSRELIVGPDATNATEQLYDLVGDDILFDRLSELAEKDPRANAWNDTEVMNRLAELGIQMPEPSVPGNPAEPQTAPAEPVAAAPAAPTAPVPVTESAELNTILKYAGIPLREGVLDDVRARMDARRNPAAVKLAATPAAQPAADYTPQVGDEVLWRHSDPRSKMMPMPGTVLAVAPGKVTLKIYSKRMIQDQGKDTIDLDLNHYTVMPKQAATSEALDRLPRPDNWKPPVPNPGPRPAPQKQTEVGDIIGFSPQNYDATASGKVFKAEVLEIGGRLGKSGLLLKLLNPEDIAANGGKDTMKISYHFANIKNPYVEKAPSAQNPAGSATSPETIKNDAVDSKGRTQDQWEKAVMAKYPDAQIQKTMGINSPMLAILPDGKRLSWKKASPTATLDEAGEWKAEADDFKEWSNHVKNELLDVAPSQRFAMAKRLSQIEMKHFGAGQAATSFNNQTGASTGNSSGMTTTVQHILDAINDGKLTAATSSAATAAIASAGTTQQTPFGSVNRPAGQPDPYQASPALASGDRPAAVAAQNRPRPQQGGGSIRILRTEQDWEEALNDPDRNRDLGADGPTTAAGFGAAMAKLPSWKVMLSTILLGLKLPIVGDKIRNILTSKMKDEFGVSMSPKEVIEYMGHVRNTAPDQIVPPAVWKFEKDGGDYETALEQLPDDAVSVRPAEVMSSIANDLISAGVAQEIKPEDETSSGAGAFGNMASQLTKKDEPVAESTELNTMLKYAGIPVAESRVLDEAGETIDHILNRFKHEVAQFEQGNDLDDNLYDALYDYYSDKGEIPYGIAKARTGDPYEWITDRLDQELGTGNHAMRDLPEADPISTFEVMSGFDTPVAEGSCNMTSEGAYCPDHGLAECAMEEEKDITTPGEKILGATTGAAIGALAGNYIGDRSSIGTLGGLALGGIAGNKIATTAGNKNVGNKINQDSNWGVGEQQTAEGWKGELAGGTAGGIAGTLAGTAMGGPVGGLIGGAAGGTGGAMTGRKLTKETGSYYESRDGDALLARIKSLALIK